MRFIFRHLILRFFGEEEGMRIHIAKHYRAILPRIHEHCCVSSRANISQSKVSWEFLSVLSTLGTLELEFLEFVRAE